MSSDSQFHRRVAFLAGVQFILIVSGWVALATVMKFEGYPDDNPFVRFKPVPVALREHGTWALLVPVVYAIAAVVAGEFPEGKLQWSWYAMSLLCLTLSMCLLLLFFASAVSPFTRPLILKYP
jgi:hypothetical protein